MEKEAKENNWQQALRNQVSALLIIDPVAGNLIGEKMEVCKMFEVEQG